MVKLSTTAPYSVSLLLLPVAIYVYQLPAQATSFKTTSGHPEITELKSFEIEPGYQNLFNGRDLTGWCFLPPSADMLLQRDRWNNRPEWPIVGEKIDLTGSNPAQMAVLSQNNNR